MSPEQCLHPIDWFARLQVSSEKYLNFISEDILRSGVPIIKDPFSLDLFHIRNISISQKESVYVIRDDLEDKLYPWESQVIVGMTGSGKTSLVKSLQHKNKENLLWVEIHLEDIAAPRVESGMASGQFSLISPDNLIAPIFAEYWKQCMLVSWMRELYYPRMFLDPTWQRRFHWFYTNYTPVPREIPGESELMEWLRGPATGWIPENYTSPSQKLRELVALICSSGDSSPSSPERYPFRVYEDVLVLIDKLETQAESAKLRLITDFQNLYDLQIPGLYFKLFAGLGWKTALRNINCVREGRVQFLGMPEWRETELKELLRRRLLALTESGGLADNWVENIPAAYLSNPAKRILITRIVQRAIKIRGQDDIDAPIHALRLTQGVLHHCAARKAQCQQAREKNETPPDPISVAEIDAKLECYNPLKKED